MQKSQNDDSPSTIATRLDRDQRILNEMILFAQQEKHHDPEQWSEPYRQVFAQAVLPVLREIPNRLPIPRLEHVKGVRLMHHFYPDRRATLESIPTWIVQAANKEHRDPQWETAAERVRHDLQKADSLQRTARQWEDKPQLLDKEDAVQVIQSLYQEYADRHQRLPKMLIAVGGTAMALHGLRPLSEDIDLYSPEDAFSLFAAELERDADIRIDVTSKTTLWNETLDIRDIESDAQVKENVDILLNGEIFHVDIAAISPETLFVIKASTLREKDRYDLPLILEKTTPQKVFQRAEVILRTMDRWEAGEVLHNLVYEMEMATMETAKPEWIAGCHHLQKRFPEVFEEHGLYAGTEEPVKNDDAWAMMRSRFSPMAQFEK